jgi:hypothetical protein
MGTVEPFEATAETREAFCSALEKVFPTRDLMTLFNMTDSEGVNKNRRKYQKLTEEPLRTKDTRREIVL